MPDKEDNAAEDVQPEDIEEEELTATREAKLHLEAILGHALHEKGLWSQNASFHWSVARNKELSSSR